MIALFFVLKRYKTQSLVIDTLDNVEERVSLKFCDKIQQRFVRYDTTYTQNPKVFMDATTAQMAMMNNGQFAIKGDTLVVYKGGSKDTVIVPFGIKTIGFSAFMKADVKHIIMPDTVETIQTQAFSESKIETIVLSKRLKYIRQGAFECCNSLHKVELPSSVLLLGEDAFRSSGLKQIVLSEKLKTIGEGCFLGTLLQTLSIPSKVEIIKDYAFKHCEQLKRVVFKGDTSKFGRGVFCGCMALTTVKLPASSQYIGTEMFADCVELKKLDLPLDLKYIGAGAFKNTGFESFVVPETVTQMDAWVFQSCKSLKFVEFRCDFIAMPSATFMDCAALERVVLPERVRLLGTSCFCRCVSLKDIELPKNLDTVCGSVFFMCESLTELVFPDTLLHLHDDFMCHCSSLKKVVIPKSLKDVLYSDAFLGCDNLQYVEMPATAYNKRAHKLPANVNLVLV